LSVWRRGRFTPEWSLPEFNGATNDAKYAVIHGQPHSPDTYHMSTSTLSEAAKAVVRRNTEEVQSRWNFEAFEELFANDFVDHTPQPNMTPNKDGVRDLYQRIRAAFPDFHADIHWQAADGELVTTYKTYHGTHEGIFLGVAPTGRKIHFETVDVMRVRNGKITDHWGVANLFSLMQQLGVLRLWPNGAEQIGDVSQEENCFVVT
jgi:steroid delta-isomerase-like uncharacterized protein